GFARYNEACTRLNELEGKLEERDSIKNRITSNERDTLVAKAALQILAEKIAQVEADRSEMGRIKPLVKEQTGLESRRTQLQTLLGELGALKERAAAAEEELTLRREEYKELSKQKLDTEKLKKQADTVLKWEEERRSAEAKLREKRAELERLTEREKEMARVRETVTRLSGEIETLEREMRSALDSEGLVAGIPGLEARDRKVVEEIATIRAVIDLDRRTL